MGAQGERAARQRRSVRSQDRRSRRARAHGAHVPARPVATDRLRAADPALERGRLATIALDQRAMAFAPGQTVPDARQFAGRLPPADEGLGLRAALRLSLYSPAGPDGAARSAARARSISSKPSACLRRSRASSKRSSPRSRKRVAVRTALSVEPRDGVLCVFMPPVPKLDDYLELLDRRRGDRARQGHAGAHRGLCAALRPAHRSHQGDPGPRRDRGQYSSRRHMAPGGGDDDRDLRGRAAGPARRRQVHDRRAPYRHGRRQSCRARRRQAGRFAVPAAARPARQPGSLLAAPSFAVLPVFRPVHRTDQPGAAARRGARRPALRT